MARLIAAYSDNRYMRFALATLVGFFLSSVAKASPIYVSLDANYGDSSVNDVSSGGTLSLLVGGLNYPSGLAIDGKGNLYIGNYVDNTISKLAIGGTVTTFANVDIPYGMAFDKDGDLFVSHLGTTFYSDVNTIDEITPDGVVISFAAGFDSPAGLAFGLDGSLYVANRDGNTISRVDTSGKVSLFASGLNTPEGLAVDSTGNIYVSDWASNDVRKITPGGVVTIFARGLDDPVGLAFDSSGILYVANYDGNSISKVNSFGVVTPFATTLGSPAFLAVQTVPEPSSIYLGGVLFLALMRWGSSMSRKTTRSIRLRSSS